MKKINQNQVDLWTLDSSVEELPMVLSAEELAYLKAVKTSERRESFKRSRNYLRWLISGYLNVEPKKISFSQGPHGKPFVELPKSSLHFNVSHSRDFTAIAFAMVPLGVDVERIQERAGMQKIAERCFSKLDRDILSSLKGKQRLKFFFKIWANLEAYIKGLGESVFRLQEIKESLAFGQKGNQKLIEDWNVLSLSLASNFAASIALQSKKSPQLRIFKI